MRPAALHSGPHRSCSADHICPGHVWPQSRAIQSRVDGSHFQTHANIRTLRIGPTLHDPRVHAPRGLPPGAHLSAGRGPLAAISQQAAASLQLPAANVAVPASAWPKPRVFIVQDCGGFCVQQRPRRVPCRSQQAFCCKLAIKCGEAPKSHRPKRRRTHGQTLSIDGAVTTRPVVWIGRRPAPPPKTSPANAGSRAW